MPTKRATTNKAKKLVKTAANKSNVSPLKDAMTKTQIVDTLADKTELTKKQVKSVLDELGSIIERHVKKRGVGHFVFPGLLKIQSIKKPAVKARKGINPFTGEETIFKAKPARNVVKIRPLKRLKEMVV